VDEHELLSQMKLPEQSLSEQQSPLSYQVPLQQMPEPVV
jgi:hypothetical protein|tara:strand:- start:267 stop:383 length:117 start_codon:yes stop_codon:yes gene_type:complete